MFKTTKANYNSVRHYESFASRPRDKPPQCLLMVFNQKKLIRNIR